MSLITWESAEASKTGIHYIGPAVRKGLEFDEVLIPQVDSRTYAPLILQPQSVIYLPVHGPCTGLRLPIAERSTIYFRQAVWQSTPEKRVGMENPDGDFDEVNRKFRQIHLSLNFFAKHIIIFYVGSSNSYSNSHWSLMCGVTKSSRSRWLGLIPV